MRSWKSAIIRPYDKGIGFVIDSEITEITSSRILRILSSIKKVTELEDTAHSSEN